MYISRKGNPAVLRYVAFLMLVLSLVLIILGVYFYMERDKQLKSEYTLIKCKITNINEYEPGKVELTLHEVNGNYPAFKYYVSYDATESDLEDIDYKLNEIKEVYFHKKNPASHEIKSFIDNYETSFIMLIIGIVFIIDFPILLIVSMMQKKKLAPEASYGIKGSVISE